MAQRRWEGVAPALANRSLVRAATQSLDECNRDVTPTENLALTEILTQSFKILLVFAAKMSWFDFRFLRVKGNLSG